MTLGRLTYGSNHALRLDGEHDDTLVTTLNIAPYFALNESEAMEVLRQAIKVVEQESLQACHQAGIAHAWFYEQIFITEAKKILS